MATKTITLEIGAYEKLKSAKRGSESFSSVVRRSILPAAPHCVAEQKCSTIYAPALTHQLPLCTFNAKEFSRVKGLKVLTP